MSMIEMQIEEVSIELVDEDGCVLELTAGAVVLVDAGGGGQSYTNGEGLLLNGHEFSLDQDFVAGIADDAAATAQEAAESHADEVAQDALTQSKSYTDGKISDAITQAQQYADSGDADILGEAKAYTDGEIDALTTASQDYSDAGDDAVYLAGKAYADAADVAVLNASKAYTDSALTSVVNDRGDYDASVGVFPTSGGTGPSGSVKKGNLWFVRVAGTIGGKAYNVDDTLRALADNPGQNPYLWGGGEGNLGFTPENRANKVNSLSSPDTDTYPTTLATYNADQSVQTYATNRANHNGTQPVSTITGLAPVATSGSKNDVSLGNVDNTSDANKPVSSQQQTALNAKLDATATAAAATKLATARTINGASFDGTANITIVDSTREPAIAGGSAGQYLNGLKVWVNFPTILTLGSATPQALAASGAAGSSANAAHEDHVHPLPTLAALGAAAAVTFNQSRWKFYDFDSAGYSGWNFAGLGGTTTSSNSLITSTTDVYGVVRIIGSSNSTGGGVQDGTSFTSGGAHVGVVGLIARLCFRLLGSVSDRTLTFGFNDQNVISNGVSNYVGLRILNLTATGASRLTSVGSARTYGSAALPNDTDLICDIEYLSTTSVRVCVFNRSTLVKYLDVNATTDIPATPGLSMFSNALVVGTGALAEFDYIGCGNARPSFIVTPP